jgi:hypothetical protein
MSGCTAMPQHIVLVYFLHFCTACRTLFRHSNRCTPRCVGTTPMPGCTVKDVTHHNFRTAHIVVLPAGCCTATPSAAPQPPGRRPTCLCVASTTPPCRPGSHHTCRLSTLKCQVEADWVAALYSVVAELILMGNKVSDHLQ